MKNSDIKLGFIARADNGGLGAESWEFSRHLLDEKDKLLVIRGEHGHYPERFQGLNATYTNGIPTDQEVESFLRGVEVLFSIETFYNWNAISFARKMGISSVLRLNYEFLPDPQHEQCDLYISPSRWNIEKIPGKVKYLQFPVNRVVLPFKQRTHINSFYHVAGHQLFEDRNGTDIFLQAIKWMRTKPSIKVYTQHSLDFDFADYPNVEIINEVENYWDIHQSDCLVLPRKYGGQSLQMNEALSTGSIVLMPSVSPQDAFLPPEMMIYTSYAKKIQAHGAIVDCHDVDPQRLAIKMDELYLSDISWLSVWANRYADKISWDTLGKEYTKLFEEVHNDIRR